MLARSLVLLFVGASEPTRQLINMFGGTEVFPKFRYRWMTSLRFKQRQVCGGALFNGNSVITAAHCVIGDTPDWVAVLFRHNNSDPSEVGQTIRVTNRIIHPEYLENHDNGNDISIWKLDALNSGRTGLSFDMGEYSNNEGRILTTIGWGTVTKQSLISPVLLEFKLPVLDLVRCSRIHPKLDPRSQFCAGFFEPNLDTCHGDSGGPIFAEEAGGRIVLVGVVSSGDGCAKKGYPGIYTRTAAYSVRSFIDPLLL